MIETTRPAPDVQDPARATTSKPSAASTSRSARARSSASSAPTAPARRRPCGCWRRCSADVGRGDRRRAPTCAASPGGPPAHRLRPAGRLDRPGRDRTRRARPPGPAVRHGQAPTRQARAAEVLDGPRPGGGRGPGDRHVLRAACVAGSTSGSASSTGRPSCSSTSRRPASTRRPAPGCGTRSAACAKRGTTVFLTTHYLEEADALADRLAIIDHGRIVAEGTADELKRQVAGDVVTLGVDGDVEHVLRPSAASRSSARRPTRTTSSACTSTRARRPCRSSSACSTAPGCVPGRRRSHRPSLDDVFLRQTGRSLREEAAA